MSTLFVDSIQPKTTGGNVTITNQANAGQVLKVKQGILRTNYAMPSNNQQWNDTPLSVTITPSSSSSQIHIQAMISYSLSDGAHGSFKIVRNNTDFLLTTEALGVRYAAHLHHHMASAYDTDYQIQNGIINVLDSPATTSELVYKLQVILASNSGWRAYLNHLGFRAENANYQAYCVSTITATEIGG